MLWVVLLAVFSLLFGVWGYLAAQSRGRTPIFWALVCAFTFFIGIAIVYSLGDPLTSERAQRGYEQVADIRDGDAAGRQSDPRPPIQSSQQLVLTTGEAPDDRRWRYLCEYHPRIGEAVRRIEPLGAEALTELKSAYLALNDATLLPGILRRLDERFGATQRGLTANGDFNRTLADLPAMEEDEPIDLLIPPSSERMERGARSVNGARALRQTQHDVNTESPPMQDYRSLRETAADTEREQMAWRAFDEDRSQRADAGNFVGVAPAVAASQTAPPDRPPDRLRLGNALVQGPANGTSSQSLTKESANRSERRDEPVEQRVQAPPPPPVQVNAAPASRPPEHRTVSPAELVGARYVETFGGLHLFALADGRVFVDRHEALGSLELARSYVDGLKPKRADA